MHNVLVGDLPGHPARQIINEDASRVVVGDAVFGGLASGVRDGRSIGVPAGISRVFRCQGSSSAIDVHIIDVADFLLPARLFLHLVHDETDILAVIRAVGIELILVRSPCEVEQLGAIRVHRVKLPIPVTVCFKYDFVFHLR